MKHYYNKQSNATKLSIQSYNCYSDKKGVLSKAGTVLRGISYIFAPKTYKEFYNVPHSESIAIIPTYKPTETTVELVSDILRYSYRTQIIVVNDNSPEEYDSVVEEIKNLSSSRVTVLRTKKNQLKAGAINMALNYIRENKMEAHAIFTMDDDVKIDPYTIGTMASELLRDERLGAVCSQARVLNKNKNLLTRLQGLEYHGFNVIRIAEAGFVQGPLVMHGMLTAFKYDALMQVGEFAQKHLIEDYEITVRLKKNGWDVKFATDAKAWTEVPENFTALWKQRVRWSVGGLILLSKERYVPAVAQDLLGHFLYLITFFTIFLGFTVKADNSYPIITYVIAMVALGQSIVSYAFYVLTLRSYEDKDIWDVLLRMSLIPEFIYANVMSMVLFGTYLFFLYTRFIQKLLTLTKKTRFIETYLTRLFLSFGFSQGWGTK